MISETALTKSVEIEVSEQGLPNTFVRGRNILFLTLSAALAYRRGIKHLITGVCETDYSGYPDCRDDTIKAMQLALNLGMEARFRVFVPCDIRPSDRVVKHWAVKHCVLPYATA